MIDLIRKRLAIIAMSEYLSSLWPQFERPVHEMQKARYPDQNGKAHLNGGL